MDQSSTSVATKQQSQAQADGVTPSDLPPPPCFDGRHFLTPAAQRFAQHWVFHRNKAAAYRAAFPKCGDSNIHRRAALMWEDTRVQAEIRRVINSWTVQSGATLAQLEHQLARVATADARLLYDEKGKLLQPHEWDADTAAAVESYSETPTRYGIVRKVRLADKHSATRTLMEAKGAFDKGKAAPGVQASFVINLGAGQKALCGAPQSLTIDVDTTKPAKRVAKAKTIAGPSSRKKPQAKARGGSLFGDKA